MVAHAVLDSSAWIAFLAKELGWERIAEVCADSAMTVHIHAVNLCEVYYDALRRAGEENAEQALAIAKELGIEVRSDLDEAFWKSVARRKAAGRISLADCFALALTERLSGELFTSDHHEFDRLATAESAIKITFIR